MSFFPCFWSILSLVKFYYFAFLMYSIVKPSKLKYLYLLVVEFDSPNMNDDDSIKKITVIDLDNNYVSQK